MDQLYKVDGTAGKGIPGAPTLHFSLLVNPPSGSVSGLVRITQATNPPLDAEIKVSGSIHALGSQSETNIVLLEGTYPYVLPPPAIGTVLEKFSAVLWVDNKWNGYGDFNWGSHGVKNVPVHSAQ
jgi:hypothetical protein